MLFPIRVLILLSCLVFGPVLGAEATYGNKKLINSTLSEILHHGRLDLDNMQITGEARINGTLNVANSTLQNITINGRANIEHSSVLGNIRTNGMVNLDRVKLAGFIEVAGYGYIEQSKIEGEMIVAADKIEIKDSTLFRIRIRPTLNTPNHPKDKQVLILNNTKVLGNVIFENGHGEIIQEKSSIMGTIEGVDALAVQKKS